MVSLAVTGHSAAFGRLFCLTIPEESQLFTNKPKKSLQQICVTGVRGMIRDTRHMSRMYV